MAVPSALKLVALSGTRGTGEAPETSRAVGPLVALGLTFGFFALGAVVRRGR